ncbi:MAG TPA: VOC family protein [Candidatus Polarisedimenticolia bacterium]|jgi:PhnB protein|nr:VOC family protein [Candidatus Polarisedimenticolia bacterium]
MAKTVKPVPDGYHTVTPYLVVKDAKRALEYYGKAFGAETKLSMPTPDGRIMHAEVRIGSSMVFVTDENPEMAPKVKAPASTGGVVTGSIFLYVPDVDAVFKRAVDAGASVIMPVTDMFWGDRFGKIVDPFGQHWGIATHTEDVPPQEMEKRSAEFIKKMAQPK